ncbi:CynX/NimT family MFS transporter [Salipiger mucosus]|uniref:MFS transporter n=1 Tax=Salipiger mucosus TaxID=263378 RepID=UPI0012EBC2AB|nr:hypothetical protein [Salipiger mucosus]
MAVLWCVGLYLRIPILVVPPLLPGIREALAPGFAATGAMTLLPLFMLAAFSAPASRIGRALGDTRSLWIGILGLAVFSMLRGAAEGVGMFLIATILTGGAITLVQIVLPPFVRDRGERLGRYGSIAYLNGMLVGEFLAAAGTIPIVLPLAAGDWRIALTLWSLPAIVIVALVPWLPPAERSEEVSEERSERAAGLRDPQSWWLGIQIAIGVGVFYSMNAYLEAVLSTKDGPISLSVALAVLNVTPVLVALTLAAAGPRLIGRRGAILAMGVVGVVNFLLFLVLDGPEIHAAIAIAGYSATMQTMLVLAYPAAACKGVELRRLNAAMTAIGYSLALLVPIGGAAILSGVGDPAVKLLPFVVLASVALCVLAMRAGPQAAE